MPKNCRQARTDGCSIASFRPTFSTFEYDTHVLLRDKHGLVGAAYVALSVFLGLLAVRLGVTLAKPR